MEKSLIVLDVKPWEAECDLEAVWKEIIKYEQEGLQWGATFKLEPVAFGIKKLVMTCTIVDSLVLLDDVTDNIEAMEEFVQKHPMGENPVEKVPSIVTGSDAQVYIDVLLELNLVGIHLYYCL